MKAIIYALFVPLLVAGGLVLANRDAKEDASKIPTPRPLTAAERNAALKAWEATPDGVLYKKWEESPPGKKVLAGAARISKHTREFTDMEAEITSLSLPPGSRLGFGLMARIDGEDYILSFGTGTPDEFQQLPSLKVGDKIVLRSHGVSWAPKYAYPIVTGDFVERAGKVVYKRVPRKGGC
ncbi:MAG: hypothetical protein EOO11_03365 [Chitinophagaceae bacterium]|nr:MAG: hypothetical protein EOO11_03365 [Chitinophagaceae bacterium]